jgi:hypothetical protein
MKLTLNQQLMLQQAWFDREEPLEWRTPAGMTEGGVTRAVNALIALGLLTQEKTITEIGEEAFGNFPEFRRLIMSKITKIQLFFALMWLGLVVYAFLTERPEWS